MRQACGLLPAGEQASQNREPHEQQHAYDKAAHRQTEVLADAEPSHSRFLAERRDARYWIDPFAEIHCFSTF